MSKLSTLYFGYLKERTDSMQEFQNGGHAVTELTNFLKTVLNANDFSKAEELLNKALSETEEHGFSEGAKYTFGLGLELAGKEE